MAKATKQERCQEAVVQGDGLQLDKEAGILRNVKFLNWESRNNRFYERAAVDEAIARKEFSYTGAKGFLDHDEKPATDLRAPRRKVRDRFHKVLRAWTQDDGGFCDIKYNTGHSFARAFEWFVENEPEAIGLSHDAICAGPYDASGKRIIKKIPKVYSIDIVCDPGSVQSLREAMEQEPELPKTDNTDDSDPVMSLEDGDNYAHEESLCDAICELVKDRKMDRADRKKKIQAIVKLLLEDNEPESDEETPEPKDEEVKPEDEKALEALKVENLQLKTELGVFRTKEALEAKRVDARKACQASGVEKLADENFIDLLVTHDTEQWNGKITWLKSLVTKSEKPESTSNAPGAKPSVDELVASVKKGTKV